METRRLRDGRAVSVHRDDGLRKRCNDRAAGGKRESMRLWRVSDGARHQTMTEHSDDVLKLEFSTDGHWLASASEDRTVILWRFGG